MMCFHHEMQTANEIKIQNLYILDCLTTKFERNPQFCYPRNGMLKSDWITI